MIKKKIYNKKMFISIIGLALFVTAGFIAFYVVGYNLQLDLIKFIKSPPAVPKDFSHSKDFTELSESMDLTQIGKLANNDVFEAVNVYLLAMGKSRLMFNAMVMYEDAKIGLLLAVICLVLSLVQGFIRVNVLNRIVGSLVLCLELLAVIAMCGSFVVFTVDVTDIVNEIESITKLPNFIKKNISAGFNTTKLVISFVLIIVGWLIAVSTTPTGFFARWHKRDRRIVVA